MGDARQHQEQSQLGQPAVTERGAQAQSVGDLLEHEQETEDASQLGALREVGGLVELAPQQAAEGFDAGRGPVGEVGEGAILDLAVAGGRIPARGWRAGSCGWGRWRYT